MPEQILVVAGPDRSRVFDLDPAKLLLIGRGQNSDTKLVDPQVSRLHCQVEHENGEYYLVDNGSASGTLVSGQKIDRVLLREGQIFQIGETKLQFQKSGIHTQNTQLGSERPTPAMAPETAAEIAELSGQTISNYTLGPIVATGQTGVIFRATDTRNGKAVAIKALGKEYTRSEEEVQRFVRAMKAVIDLNHPNIVDVIAAGRSKNVLWVAMEFVEGESLKQVIERIGTLGMVDWQYALRVAADVARGLEAAHAKQIIHRNIKPANILVRQSDGVAKLGDLMLAKGLEGMAAQQITKPGQMVGDLIYMSPERTSSETAVDTRSDIYSLGATLYQLLAGRPPFESKSMVELVNLIRTQPPRSPKKYQLAIPDLFEGSVMKMLAKDPKDRFQTPSDLLRDLERVAKYNAVRL
jgi:serine/threonine-protein kinase